MQLNSPLAVATRPLPLTSTSVDHEPIAPIHLLPAEILSEIFLKLRAFIVADGEPLPDPIPKLDKTITRVCKTWRNIAYGTPTLWTNLTSQDPKLIDSYLERYLPLASGCRLDLHTRRCADILLCF